MRRAFTLQMHDTEYVCQCGHKLATNRLWQRGYPPDAHDPRCPKSLGEDRVYDDRTTKRYTPQFKLPSGAPYGVMLCDDISEE